METTIRTVEDMTLDLVQYIDIKAPIEKVWERMLDRFSNGNTRPDGTAMDLRLERWPGGRWFRDRGNNAGHLWGHVQVIKAPTLLELSGPMFMSYPALNHVEVKLEESNDGVRVTLRHRAVGLIEPAHRDGVDTGWRHILGLIRNDFV